MQLAAVRWIADVLKEPGTGLAAVIADGVPSQPDGVEVPLVSVYDETRDAWVAYGGYPETIKRKGPALIVRGIGAAESDALPNIAIETARVAVHVVVPMTTDGPSGKDVRLQAAFLLRAAKRCIARAIPEEVGAARPIVWGCEITPPQDTAFTYQPMYDAETLQGGAIIDALLVTVSVDDPWSRGYAADSDTLP